MNRPPSLPAATAAAFLALAAATAPAQEGAPNEGERLLAWRAQLPTGTYTVALRSITSVSLHEYVVDNVAKVREVTIDTTGATVARFYHIEPLTAESPLGIGQATLNKVQELAEEAVERSGQSEALRKVLKNYPTTTHAHTVEYRLESRQALEKLFKSADESFRLFRPGTFKTD